ncbi:MAG: class A beta-lactamase-related serine hydrolase [Kaiparowitsia implicata GSE-PSE-MK54-09C]|nr:class A beta-lactamase-related serine hydrolase [Kaiparowitsia implicata GSE-PSE-MK54-09C]
MHSYPALTPVVEASYDNTLDLDTVRSLENLRQLREQLIGQIAQQPQVLLSSSNGAGSSSSQLTQKLQAVEIRIQIEEMSKERLDEAIALANDARSLERRLDPEESTEAAEGSVYQRWDEAVALLLGIPRESLVYDQALEELEDYQARLAIAAYRYDTARSSFLEEIAEESGYGSDVRITVCSSQRECRRYQGDVEPASPASLIKVPIAIALMQKVEEDGIDISEIISISRSNYTEDAAKIWVGAEYPLRQVNYQMLAYSSNIATNELIDYVGMDYINQVMRDRGYRTTRVNTKLIGESIAPSNGITGVPNSITTDELTDMMVGIYNQEHPGDDVILESLVNQYDWDLGYSTVRQPAIWVGEKTGQNSKMLGATMGVTLNGTIYVITLTIDYTANEPAYRAVMRSIVDHLIANDGF